MCSFPPHGYIALVPLERLGNLETLAYLGKTTTNKATFLGRSDNSKSLLIKLNLIPVSLSAQTIYAGLGNDLA